MSYSNSAPTVLDNSDFQPHISPSKEELVKGGWICLSNYKPCKDMSTRIVNRCPKSAKCNSCDCVGALAILRRTLKYDCLVLVKQYRPALKAFTLEFPAGHCTSSNESAEFKALQELKEETGYVAKVKHISPAISLDPNLSNSTMNIVSVEIDGDTPLNKLHQTCMKDQETIEVVHIPMDELLQRLNGYTEQGIMVDSKVYTFAIGLAMGIKLGKLHG